MANNSKEVQEELYKEHDRVLVYLKQEISDLILRNQEITNFVNRRDLANRAQSLAEATAALQTIYLRLYPSTQEKS